SEITLRLWSLSDCTSRIRTPETLPSASTTAFTTSARRPSLMLGTDSMILGMAPPVSPKTGMRAAFSLATPRRFPHNGRGLSGRRSSNLTRIQRHRLRRLLDEGRDLLSRDRGHEAADVFGRILLLDPDNSEARPGLEQAP